MAKQEHTCTTCRNHFTGRKRKYCCDSCADDGKAIRSVGRRQHGVTGRRALAQFEHDFIQQWGSYQNYLNRPGPKRGLKPAEYYHSPEYKRIQRARSAEREGRTFTPQRLVRAYARIRQARLRRRSAFRQYIARAERIAAEIQRPAPGEFYRLRYQTDAAFRAREIARSRRSKRTRRELEQALGDGTVTRQLLEAATHCSYCGCDVDESNRTLDHKEPLSRGGPHTADNVTPACRSCNAAKQDMPYADWVERISGRTA
ncbi:MAG: HNH endonuclease [Spiribacter salinus]|uniref:HNH endonuclease n=1 Tax=Spiribacter salinus TaxID=1335746 RepID=A0A540VIJ3_9GAMM|nr:MAG: HNH endonuclease [Spiribacter salinus]